MLLVTWEMANIIAGTMTLSFDYQKQRWHLALFFLVRSSSLFLRQKSSAHLPQAIILCVGTIGSTAWGRSHRFWLGSGMYGLAVWAVLCITLLATSVTRLVSITPSEELN